MVSIYDMKEFQIDLREISGYIDGEEEKTIHSGLRKQGMLRKSLLYSVFNWNRARQLRQTGNYRKDNPDSIFALTKEELVWESENPRNRNDLKQLTNSYGYPAIAVYDKTHFTRDPNVCAVFEYSFKNPTRKTEALVGIARILIA